MRELKENFGLRVLRKHGFMANWAWLLVVATGLNLCRWTQLLGQVEPDRDLRAKRLRFRYLAVPAMLVMVCHPSAGGERRRGELGASRCIRWGPVGPEAVGSTGTPVARLPALPDRDPLGREDQNVLGRYEVCEPKQLVRAAVRLDGRLGRPTMHWYPRPGDGVPDRSLAAVPGEDGVPRDVRDERGVRVTLPRLKGHGLDLPPGVRGTVVRPSVHVPHLSVCLVVPGEQAVAAEPHRYGGLGRERGWRD